MKIIDISIDKHRSLLGIIGPVIGSDDNSQFPADIDSKSGKITIEMALTMMIDGIHAVYFIIWRKKDL
jgi:hypothetical protein